MTKCFYKINQYINYLTWRNYLCKFIDMASHHPYLAAIKIIIPLRNLTYQEQQNDK